MFNIGGGELLVIFLVALVVLGPTKLPEAARQMGKMMGEFRKLSAGFQAEVRQAMDDPVTHAVKKAEAAEPTAIEAKSDKPTPNGEESGIATLDSVSVDGSATEPETGEPEEAGSADDPEGEHDSDEPVQDKRVHTSTAIPPLAPMSGSDALSNSMPNTNGSVDGDAPIDDPLDEDFTQFAASKSDDSEPEGEAEATSTVVDPPMFGDR